MRDFAKITSQVESTRFKRNNKSNATIFIKFLLSLVVCGLIVIFGINFFGYHSSKVATTTYQAIKDSIKTSGILIRRERVTFAPQGGEVELYFSEGARISTGNKIAELHDENQSDNLYNYYAGIISYKVDGLEMTLREDNLKNLNYDHFVNLKGKYNPVSSGDKVNMGRPIFKVIDNFKFYLAVLLPQNQLANYEVGTEVEVLFPGLEEYFIGKINSILLDKPQNIMVIEFNRFIPKLIDLRKTDVEIIRKRYHGIVVPSSALIKRDDKLGVMVNGYTKNYFKEVELIGEVTDQAVIKGVGPGVKVILN
ncbi:HlyD family efflux transporter periplasmic adaptor subunit [Orenia metallireducens]|jgi:putative membrane fusion protein|nr:HlyD family efflux transporter periplasmic adaptor subunit [Orenia metallireducens]